MPALSAWARSTRAQKPWIVEIQAPSAARASARRPSSTKRPRTRVRISAAAFSVNVIARIALHRHVVLDHGRHEALDQHGRLAGARPGPHHQRVLAAADGALLLLGVSAAHPSHRQIEG